MVKEKQLWVFGLMKVLPIFLEIIIGVLNQLIFWLTSRLTPAVKILVFLLLLA